MPDNQSDGQSRNLPSSQGKPNLPAQNIKPNSLIEESLANLTPQQRQNLLAKAAEEALRIEVKLREQDIDYQSGRRLLEDHIETFDRLDKSGNTTRHTVNTETRMGAGKVTVQSKTGGVCFVATATYESPNHPDVILLRRFRDETLANYDWGVRFIEWYWKTGPSMAKVVLQSKSLKRFSKWTLSKLVMLIRYNRHYQ